MTRKLIGKIGLKLSFTNKIMTAYGGFTLLAELFERLKLRETIEEIVPFSEVSSNSTGAYAKILKLGLTSLAGGFRFTHSLFLGDSTEIYEKAFGVKRIPRSITAVTRFFNKFKSWQKNEEFSDRLWDYLFSTVIPFGKIGEDYLTFDSTVITRYGKQEGAKKGYNVKKKGRPSHHPIIAFLNRSKYVVNIWNRSGNAASGNGIIEFAKQTLTRLQNRLKIKGFLADSGFYNIGFIKYAESLGCEYIICAPMIHVLQNQIYKLDDWKELSEEISVSEFTFQHNDEKWDKNRRYIVVRRKVRSGKDLPGGKQLSLFPEEDEKVFGYRYGLYITSSDAPPEDLWRTYRLRASDENIIKENKQDFGLEGYSMKSFYSTEAAMLVRIMFYNIFNLFRSEFLSEPESKQTLHTLRMKYFIVPSVLGSDGKSPVLRLGIRRENIRRKFRYIFSQIDMYFNKCNAFEGGGEPIFSKIAPTF